MLSPANPLRKEGFDLLLMKSLEIRIRIDYSLG